METLELQSPCQMIKSDEEKVDDKKSNQLPSVPDIIYKVDDVPSWYISFFLGFQHYLTMCFGAVIVPYLVAPKMCIKENDPARGHLISTTLFVSGIATFIQTTFGLRLPIIQGPSGAFLITTAAILNFPKLQCPAWSMNTTHSNATDEEWQELWQVRMREIQGSIIIASLVEVVIGLTGVIGIIMRWITPLVVTPIITLIGLSFLKESTDLCSKHWGIAFLGLLLMLIFSQYLARVDIPCFLYSKKKGCRISRFPIFKLFPVLLSIVVLWSLCAVLTVTNVFPPGSLARTDGRVSVLRESEWFRFPYPGQWGLPTFSAAAIIGMLAAVFSSTSESIGDYHACAKMAGVTNPPVHALNRGIFMEGVSCVLAGIWGTGGGLTSYSTNIAVIGITKVASRRVVQYTAVLLLLFGMCGKFSALFILIPQPILGGVFLVLFGMVSSVGLSNLQYVNLNSSRNLFVLGSSIFLGLAIPYWAKGNQEAIQTGSQLLDQLLLVFINNNMAIGGVVGFLFDNTIPGTLEERGLTKWCCRIPSDASSLNTSQCYDLPYCMGFLKRNSWSTYLPVSPTFNEGIFKKLTEVTHFFRIPCNKSSRSQESNNRTEI